MTRTYSSPPFIVLVREVYSTAVLTCEVWTSRDFTTLKVHISVSTTVTAPSTSGRLTRLGLGDDKVIVLAAGIILVNEFAT